jgi:hypothetical protein
MKLNSFPTILLILLSFTFSSTARASAPSSIAGNKFTFDVNYDVDSPFIKVFYFLPDSVRLEEDWEQGSYTWTRSGSSGTILMEDYGNEKFEIIVNYSNYTFQAVERSGTQSQIAGSGTFTVESYSERELPYDKYFSDDFTDPNFSESIWGNYSNDGFSAKIHEGGYTMYGTMSEDGNRWGQEIAARSLLGLDKDWYVHGTAFSENGERIELSIECDLDTLFQLEVHLGSDGYGVNSSLQYERYDQGDDYDEQHLNNYDFSSNYSDSKNATFRIRNSASEKSFHIEWLEGTEWKNLNSFNWHTGTLTKEATSGWNNSSNFTFDDWESMENYYFNPQMEFGVPNSLTVNLGDYGFTSFSVTKGAPEPDPEYAPSSLVGMIYKGSMNDTYQFVDESNAIFYHQESNFQSSEVSNITYTWNPDGNSGSLTTSLDETTTLSFTSASEGTFQWQENGGSSSNGSFTLTDASAGNAPSSLAGDSMIAGTTTYIFKENGVVTIRTTTGSQNNTYGFVKSGNNEIVFNIPAHAEGATSTIYKMTFSSTDSGILSEGASGSFQYFVDGSNQPPTKGWMWFDEYPWVYSDVEGGWLYFNPTGSKLMVYSAKDEAWREMTK